MAENPTTEAPMPKVVPKYRGHYVQKKWYCDCLLEAKCRPVKMQESEYFGMKFWSCPKVEEADRCQMWMLDVNSAKARDWLAQYGPDTPDFELFPKPVPKARIPEPRTPPRKRLGYDVNPFTLAKVRRKRYLTIDEPGDLPGPGNGEGRAPPLEAERTESTEEEAVRTSSDEMRDDSDGHPAKRSRYSPSTPVPNAPRKKRAQVAFVTPTRPIHSERSFLETLQAAKANDEKKAEGERARSSNSLPTPETGNRTRLFEPRGVVDGEVDGGRAVESITSSLLHQLNSPINLSDSEHHSTPSSSAGYETPTKASRPSGYRKAKGKERIMEQRHDTSHDLSKAILGILQSEGHAIKESTRYQIDHEVELALDVRDTTIRAGEKTIARLRARLDELEETVALLTGGWQDDGVIELSD